MLKITPLSNGIDIAGISFPNNSLFFEIYNSTTINIYLVVSKRKIFSSYYLDFLNSSNQQYASPQAVIDDLLLNNNQPTGGGGGGTASSITFTPNGDISSTNVQSAIQEVRDDTDTKLLEKEDIVNKSTNVITDQASNTKYPTVKALFDWTVGLFVQKNANITGATKTKITYDSKGLVTSGVDATTADINDSTNRRYVTDAQQTVISNTSGTNTGDVAKATSTDINTGTDNTKYVTASAIADSEIRDLIELNYSLIGSGNF